MDLLRNQRSGSFLEIGGNDGISTTNTFHLEACLGWQGILVEGHPENYKRMLRTRPGVLGLGMAVCKEHGFIGFTNRSGVASGINELMTSSHRKRFRIAENNVMPVPCGPLGDWMSVLKATSIDFFVSAHSIRTAALVDQRYEATARRSPPRVEQSLDVEGAEMLVLQTLDWNVLTLGVLLIECTSSGGQGCKSKQDEAIGTYLSDRGLTRLGAFRARHDIWDLVFVNESRLAELDTGWNHVPWEGANSSALLKRGRVDERYERNRGD